MSQNDDEMCTFSRNFQAANDRNALCIANGAAAAAAAAAATDLAAPLVGVGVLRARLTIASIDCATHSVCPTWSSSAGHNESPRRQLLHLQHGH